MINDMTIFFGSVDPRDDFSKFQEDVTERLLTMDELNIVSKLSFHHVHNDSDSEKQEDGLKSIYFRFIDILYYRLKIGEYDEVIFADLENNKERVKIMINRLAHEINLVSHIDQPNKLDGNDSCILYASRDVIEKVSGRMKLLIDGLSVYVDSISLPQLDKINLPPESHPFAQEQQYQCFRYLSEKFTLQEKQKWSYIFWGLKDSYGQDFDTSEPKYMRFIFYNYQMVGGRPTRGGKPVYIQEVEKLIKQFKIK